MRTHRVAVRRGGSAHTSWETAVRPVDERLRGLLDPHAGFRERSARPVRRREVPVPRVMVIIGWGGQLTVSRDTPPMSGLSAFVVGLSTTPALVDHDGIQDCVELCLTPLGAYRLLGVPMTEISGRVIDLADLWGSRRAGELLTRLAEASDWASRFDLLDDEALRRTSRGPRPAPELVAAWTRLQRHRGSLAIGELVADTGWSRRRLAARFREQLGLTPKELARVLRFNRAARLVAHPADHPLAEIALTCGFYDQAHLNREFRALAGCTPTRYRAARLLPTLVGVAGDPPA